MSRRSFSPHAVAAINAQDNFGNTDCIHCCQIQNVGYLEHMLSMGLSCEPTLSPKFILWILDEVKCFKTHFDYFRKGRSRWVPQINFGFRVEVGINCKS